MYRYGGKHGQTPGKKKKKKKNTSAGGSDEKKKKKSCLWRREIAFKLLHTVNDISISIITIIIIALHCIT